MEPNMQNLKLTILVLALLQAFLLSDHTEAIPTISEKPITGLLCDSQFVLANAACIMLPPAPLPPPPPGSRSESSESPTRGHRHGHHRSRRHVYHESSTQEECCHWLHQVDSHCVCDLLVKLPVFLARPIHNYTVFVDESCSVSFQCAGRLMRA